MKIYEIYARKGTANTYFWYLMIHKTKSLTSAKEWAKKAGVKHGEIVEREDYKEDKIYKI